MPTPPSPSGAVTTAMTLDRAEFIRKNWKDAVAAKLSEGWKALQTVAPAQTSAIDQISDLSVEAADQGILNLVELMIGGLVGVKQGGIVALVDPKARVFSKIKPLVDLTKVQQEADKVLGEVKGALLARQGVIDPASTKAMGVIQDALTLPLDKVASPERAEVYRQLRGILQGGKAIKGVTDLYYQLDGAAKSIVTLLVAGAVGASQVGNYIKFDKKADKLSVTMPPQLSLATRQFGTFAITNFQMEKKTLTGLGAKWNHAVGDGELTVSAQYQSDLKKATKGVNAAASWTSPTGTGVTGTYTTDFTRQSGSVGVKTSTEIPYTKATFRTDAGLTASAPSQIRAGKDQDIDVGLRARAEVSAPLSKTVDFSAYAQAEQTSFAKKKGAAEAGIQVTGRFGADESLAQRVARKRAEKEAQRALHAAVKDRNRGNIRITARMTGRLPKLKALLQDPSIPALTPVRAERTGFSTTTKVVGGILVLGAIGAAVWGWQASQGSTQA